MEDFKQRVVDERAELELKLQRLSIFIATPAARSLDPEDFWLLQVQALVMESYVAILSRRLTKWGIE
jgi:uncharacterized protein